MPRFILKKKKVIITALFVVVVLVGVAAPIPFGQYTVHAQLLPTNLLSLGPVVWNAMIETIFSYIGGFIIMATGWVLWAAGSLLNFVFDFTVVNMNLRVANITGINTAWEVMRDLANLGFIFILLYIAIGTILRLSNVHMKKMLVNVIIIALLLNFSLFFTKIVIDVSNIITIGFYNKVVLTSPPGQLGGSDLSGAFMNSLGLTSFFDVQGVADMVSKAGSAWKMLLTGLFGGVMFLTTAFVFLAAAVLFIIRYVTFIFLMIFSPLAFAAMALPNDKYSSRWWKRLWENAIFAPVFMIIVWTTLTILKGVINPGSPGKDTFIGGFKSEGAPGPEFSGALMNFIIVIVMIVATLIISKELGAAGAAGAIKYGKKLRGQATGFIGRNTVGRAAANADKALTKGQIPFTSKVPYLNRINNVPGLANAANSRFGRWVRSGTTEKLAEEKFGGSISRKDDAKRIKEQKVDIANVGRQIELMKKIKDPTTTQDELEKIYSRMSNKDVESLGAKDLTKHVQYLSVGQFEHVVEKSDKYNDKEKQDIRNARFEPLKTAINTSNTAETKKLTKALSDKEIELLDPNITTNPDFIKNLSQNQTDNIMKSSRFTSSQKNKIRDAIAKPLEDAVKNGVVAEIDTLLGRMKAPQIAKIKPELFFENSKVMIGRLTPQMMTKMSDELDAATLKQIGDEIRHYHRTKAGGHPAHEYITTGLGKGLFG